MCLLLPKGLGWRAMGGSGGSSVGYSGSKWEYDLQSWRVEVSFRVHGTPRLETRSQPIEKVEEVTGSPPALRSVLGGFVWAWRCERCPIEGVLRRRLQNWMCPSLLQVFAEQHGRGSGTCDGLGLAQKRDQCVRVCTSLRRIKLH